MTVEEIDITEALNKVRRLLEEDKTISVGFKGCHRGIAISSNDISEPIAFNQSK